MPAFDDTTSLFVAVGIRKLDGGCSWLFELRLVTIVGLKTPYAAATRVSLICGSSRSARRSTFASSAIFTASSTVRRSVAGVVWAEAADANAAARTEEINVLRMVSTLGRPEGRPLRLVGNYVLSRTGCRARPSGRAAARRNRRTFDASSNSE